MTARDPHLFIAKDAWNETSLWFGTGPDDRHCELVDLGGHGGAHPIVLRKALWEALAASPLVEDAEDVVTA